MPDSPDRDVRSAVLEARGVSKSFAGVEALRDVSVAFLPGEVHAVIGENGAGKSTLMKILAGVQPQDSGQILVNSKVVTIDSVQAALSFGIALIHQELNLADNLNVGANIFLGREPRRLGLIDFRAIDRDARRYLKMVGLDVSPSTLVKLMSVGHQQMVEIAKALSVNARVLIMDEPTSCLSLHETEKLFGVIDALRSQNVCVIYISHRLAEIERIADRVTVLRDGEVAGQLSSGQITHDSMVQLMVGRDISQFYAKSHHQIGDCALKVDRCRTPAWPAYEIDFRVAAGEIVGIAGLVGSGRTELLESIFGITPPLSGEISVGGRKIDVSSCRDPIASGMALIPEDRKQQGLILETGARMNIGLPGLFRHKQLGALINFGQQRRDAAEMIEALRIKTASDTQPVQFLSGGNQQKVVIGKWLAMHPSILLMDEPTRGVDVGAKQEIYRLMEQLASRQVAIVFVSSELEEVMSMSDRVLVMHEGRIMGELDRAHLSEESIMQLATGNVGNVSVVTAEP